MTAKERREEQEKLDKELYRATLDSLQKVCLRAIRMEQMLGKIGELVKEGLETDGGHHKQWYLYEIARGLDVDILKDTDEGVEP